MTDKKIYDVSIVPEAKRKIVTRMRKEIADVARRVGVVQPKRTEITDLVKSALDQLNKHVTSLAQTKSAWTFDDDHVPVSVTIERREKCDVFPNLKDGTQPCVFVRTANMKWNFIKADEGLTYDNFKDTVINDLEELAIIAAFYSAFSYFTN